MLLQSSHSTNELSKNQQPAAAAELQYNMFMMFIFLKLFKFNAVVRLWTVIMISYGSDIILSFSMSGVTVTSSQIEGKAD